MLALAGTPAQPVGAPLVSLAYVIFWNATQKVKSLSVQAKPCEEGGHLNKVLVGHLKLVMLKNLGKPGCFTTIFRFILGKWKMSHYFAEKMFSPVLISPVLDSQNNIQVSKTKHHLFFF